MKLDFAILLKLHSYLPHCNVFLVRFQTIKLQTRGRNKVSSALFQCRDIETTLNEGYSNLLCLQVIYLSANTGLFINIVYLK